MVLTWYACATIGAVGVTTNTKSVGPEITYLAGHAQCVAAITQPKFAALISGERARSEVGRGHRRQQRRGGRGAATCRPRDLRRRSTATQSGYPGRPIEPMLPAGIMYTSGTTSRPKAVVHTHANALWASRSVPTTSTSPATTST